MTKVITYQSSSNSFLMGKLADYAQLSKLRLSSFVIFSSVMAYIYGLSSGAVISIPLLILFALGGLLVTISSNALNQILEKEQDTKMSRTELRPLPAGRMSILEATIFAGLAGVSGIFIIGYYFNPLSGLLAALSLMTYSFIYTPFKQVSYTSVYVGAFPGAMPLLIGWTAATGTIGIGGILLFAIQFAWQMPHFWAIAWLLHPDYQKADYHLLPSEEGKDRKSSLYILPWLVLVIIVGLLPYFFGISGITSAVIVTICGLFFLQKGLQLAIDLTDKSAKGLMFASFVYVPVVFISLILDKI